MAPKDEKILVPTTGGPTKKRFNEMATIQDDDERLLAQIGYKQV